MKRGESLNASNQSDLDDGALGGLRVLEIGSLIAGPLPWPSGTTAPTWSQWSPRSGQIRCGAGARYTRGAGVCSGRSTRATSDASPSHRALGRQELFEHLARAVDVVIESFRPGTLERWNLGFERLSQINPRPYRAGLRDGQTGPIRQPATRAWPKRSPGCGTSPERRGAPPVRMSLSLGDSLAGLFAAQGILLALMARERTGLGQVVDAALTDSCLAVTESMIPDFDRACQHIRQPSGTRLNAIAPSNIYESSDGRWLVVAANQDTVFGRLCSAMGKPELASAPAACHACSRGQGTRICSTLRSVGG